MEGTRVRTDRFKYYAFSRANQRASLVYLQTDPGDLDALIGSWQEDKAFDRAVADFERVDEEAWK